MEDLAREVLLDETEECGRWTKIGLLNGLNKEYIVE